MQYRTALITGITGQDGYYLCNELFKGEASKKYNYIIHGIIRRHAGFHNNTERLDEFYESNLHNSQNSFKGRFFLHYGDLSDGCNIFRLINEIKPDEIYNLAAMSHVKISFEEPEYSSDIDGVGVLRILEASKQVIDSNNSNIYNPRIYQASTSEMFGGSDYQLNESSLMCPHSPYAVAKLYAYNMCNVYRKSYNMHISNGILFNHGSPMRGFNFIEQKIVYGAVKCISDIKKKIYNESSIIRLGNIYAKRDIGHAKDYVHAMWLMLQQDTPDDYVIATGETYSIKSIAEITFKLLGYTIHWSGSNLNETASIYIDDIFNFYTVIKIDEKYFRPFDVECLIGDASKAKTKLNWTPSVSFEMLINEMIDKCKLKLHL